jgi:hypothetical protein
VLNKSHENEIQTNGSKPAEQKTKVIFFWFDFLQNLFFLNAEKVKNLKYLKIS